MEISAEKTKLMTNNTSGINTEIKVNGQKLETVTSFKYLGLVITNEGSKPEILSRIAQTSAALTRLKPVWIRQKKRWEDNVREWTGLEFGKSQRAAKNREKWRKLVAKSSVVPQRPSRLMD